jgi:hypothetical protein
LGGERGIGSGRELRERKGEQFLVLNHVKVKQKNNNEMTTLML